MEQLSEWAKIVGRVKRTLHRIGHEQSQRGIAATKIDQTDSDGKTLRRVDSQGVSLRSFATLRQVQKSAQETKPGSVTSLLKTACHWLFQRLVELASLLAEPVAHVELNPLPLLDGPSGNLNTVRKRLTSQHEMKQRVQRLCRNGAGLFQPTFDIWNSLTHAEI